MAGLGGGRGESEDYRRGKPRAYATSVSAGWGGGEGGPNISSVYQLVGRGEEEGEVGVYLWEGGRGTRSGGGESRSYPKVT